MTEARNDLVKFIQEGNGIREEAINLLEDLQRFHLRFFESHGESLRDFDTKFSHLYRKFLNYDKRAGLFSETLAMAIATDSNGNFARLPTLDENTLFSIYTSHLSLHRETLRNLLRDAENRITSFREVSNNRVVRFIAWASLVVAVIGILLAINNNNRLNRQSYFNPETSSFRGGYPTWHHYR